MSLEVEMSLVVEGVYDSGIVTLKSKIKIPDKSKVLVIFQNKRSKKKFWNAAGSWKDIDDSFTEMILKSRKNLRERGFKI
jgi:predicted DNA-binding antitoxin AbrB/MazE fold protein